MRSLSCEGVSVSYEGVPVLREVSLRVEAGTVLGIVGESGSGKSTLLRAWLRLIPVQAGSIRWGDDDVTAPSASAMRALRRVVQPVFQDPSTALDPRLTIRQSLREPFEIAGEAVSDEHLTRVLAEVQLAPELLARRPSELSAGQRQRVVLARALSVNPEALLLDEPVSALDVSVQAQVLALLEAARRTRRLTLVLVSHDLSVVRVLADRVAVLFAGRVVELGATAEVLTAPRHPYTRRLIHGREGASLEAPIAAEPGCAFRSRCALAEPRCLSTPRLGEGAHRWACHVVK